jgi:hypothetical protein
MCTEPKQARGDAALGIAIAFIVAEGGHNARLK